MNTKNLFNVFSAVCAFFIGAAFFKNFDMNSGTFENSALATVYGITFLLSLYFVFRDNKMNMDSIWTVNYENNSIKIKNTWFAGEELYVNEQLQDHKVGVISSDLSGHLINARNEKELIKANLYGTTKVKCNLFINDKKVELNQEK